MKTLIITLMLSTANAGWWSNFCEKHLVAQDPYEFSEAPIKYLADAYRTLAVDMYFSGWTEKRAKRLKVMGNELRRRPYDFYVKYLLNSYDELEF